jgi:uncharacterized low-complexity protein
MASNKTALTLALGSAIATTLAATPVSAAENPFAAQTLQKGYMVAEADKAAETAKATEAKCGAKKEKEGKCGAKAKKSGADAEANKKMIKEGKCGEGMCGAKNAKEGKCGEAKCGAKK